MGDHHLQRDWKRVVEPIKDHADRIADQQEIDMGVEETRHRRGIGGERDDGRSALALVYFRDRDPVGAMFRAHPSGPPLAG